MSFVISCIKDGELLAFHRAAFPPTHQAAIDTILTQAFERVANLNRPALIQHATTAILEGKSAVKIQADKEKITVETMTQGEMARAKGYTGDVCSRCHNFTMKQAGHCLVCETCGETTGCS